MAIFIVLGSNLAWYFLSDSWLRSDLRDYPRTKKYTRISLLLWMSMILIPLVVPMLGLGNPLGIGPWIWISIVYLWMMGIMFWMLGLAAVGIPAWGYFYYRNRNQLRKMSNKISENTKADNIIADNMSANDNIANDKVSDDELVASDMLEKDKVSDNPVTTDMIENNKASDNLVASNMMENDKVSDKEERSLSRRQLLKLGLVAAPPFIVGTTSIATVFAKNNLNVRYIDLPVKDLPPDLEGYTITHLSDIHVGMVTGRKRVENIVETANQLKSNMTVVTGDILDNNFDYMPDLVDTIGQLKAEQGVHLCIGNHDKIHNAEEWITTVRDAGLDLLIDESIVIDTGKTPIKLLGIDYSRHEYEDMKNIQKADRYSKTPDNSFKILLAHHPHAFDAATEAGIPVTLAGHTHGGQIAIRIGDEFELFNAGHYLFRYVDGIYQKEQGSSLYVHRGSGDWFPLRVGVPTEVVQLRLVRSEV